MDKIDVNASLQGGAKIPFHDHRLHGGAGVKFRAMIARLQHEKPCTAACEEGLIDGQVGIDLARNTPAPAEILRRDGQPLAADTESRARTRVVGGKEAEQPRIRCLGCCTAGRQQKEKREKEAHRTMSASHCTRACALGDSTVLEPRVRT